MHKIEDLICLFSECFERDYNTILVKGDHEPIYLPANNTQLQNQIVFAHGFYSSALHECAHWFIAGDERRKKIDFDYWYEPDGRTVEQQKLFEQVETKSQAIEWILSVAARHRFRISIDNLNGVPSDPQPFKEKVYQQVKYYIAYGLPTRATIFHAAICQFYNTSPTVNINLFDTTLI